MRRTCLIFAAFLPALLFTGCADRAVPVEEDGEGVDNGAAIKVVTTIYPLADIIGELGGDKVDIAYLLPAGASPHTFEPTVEQARLVEEADLFVYIGAGLDDWAAQLATASGPALPMLELARHVALLESAGAHQLEDCDDHSPGDTCMDTSGDTCMDTSGDTSGGTSNETSMADQEDHHHQDDHCDHDHGPMDPHFWLDPLLVRDAVCPPVTAALIELAVEEEVYFADKLEQYRKELTVLHEEAKILITSLPRRNFMAFHSAWQYFARRYGLREVAVIAHFPGQEPSAGWVAELIDLATLEDVGAILAEPQFSTALAERIAAESGIEVAIVDPLGGENVPGRETYLSLMRYNLTVFTETMQ